MTRRPSPLLIALLPWFAAAIVWFGVVAPLRGEQVDRFSEQRIIRRDRLKADRAVRETSGLVTRIRQGIGSACRAPVEPAGIRQRIVAASFGLPLSPLSLSVTGPPTPGAMVEAEGSRSSTLELVRRLGDPARGGFLRSVSIRDLRSMWAVSVTTGVIHAANVGPAGPIPPCPAETESARVEVPSPPPAQSRPSRPAPAVVAPRSPEVEPTPTADRPPVEAPPPFSLVAFVMTQGTTRVSVRNGAEVRVLSVGDEVAGWRCLSIDRDEGAIFANATGRRVVLRPSGPGG